MNAIPLSLLEDFNPRQFEVPNTSNLSDRTRGDGKHKVGGTAAGHSIYSQVKGNACTYSIQRSDGQEVDGVVFERRTVATGNGSQARMAVWICWEDEGRQQSVCVRVG